MCIFHTFATQSNELDADFLNEILLRMPCRGCGWYCADIRNRIACDVKPGRISSIFSFPIQNSFRFLFFNFPQNSTNRRIIVKNWGASEAAKDETQKRNQRPGNESNEKRCQAKQSNFSIVKTLDVSQTIKAATRYQQVNRWSECNYKYSINVQYDVVVASMRRHNSKAKRTTRVSIFTSCHFAWPTSRTLSHPPSPSGDHQIHEPSAGEYRLEKHHFALFNRIVVAVLII